MKEKIPLKVDGRIVLSAIIESEKLRIPRQRLSFTVDTGSTKSYLSERDVERLQISIK